MRLPSAAMRSVALHSLVFLALACSNDGSPPPEARLHYPIAIAMSPDGGFLFVANSNFNLRYNAGSLQSYDLGILEETLDEQCGADSGVRIADREECGVIPEQDDRDDLPELIQAVQGLFVDEVLIGSYADGMVLSPLGNRLYLPVRSDANLTFVDVRSSGELDCGASEDDEREVCGEDFRRGIDEAATLRGIELPADPVGIHVGPISDLVEGDAEGDYVLTAHRSGRLSLFLDEPSPPDGLGSAAGKPRLVHTLTGLPEELVDLAVKDDVAWITNSGDPVMSRTAIAVDDDRERSFLFDAGALPVRDVDTGRGDIGDTRVIRFDPRDGVNRAYVLSRLPRALLTVDLDASGDHLDVDARVAVGFGPSRLEVRQFTDHGGRTLAFVSCFDSGDLYVIDVDASRLVGIVRNLGGPFELAVDDIRDRLYVLDFTSSVIRVITLEPMFRCLDDGDYMENMPEVMGEECSPVTLGVLGRPQAVRELI